MERLPAAEPSPPETRGSDDTCTVPRGPRPPKSPAALSWNRIALLFALLHLPLLYHGCDGGKTYFTAGPAVPCVELTFEDQGWWPDQVEPRSPWSWAADLLLVLLAFWLIRRACPRTAKALASRTWLASLLIAILITNSFLYLSSVWQLIVWQPAMHVAAGVHWVILGDLSENAAESGLEFDLASRLCFAALTAATYVLIKLFAWTSRRYLFVDARRWWQLRLGGLIGLMLLLGAGFGMLLRLWVAD